MKMTGYKTEAVYRRYAIVSQSDLHEAATKLGALAVGKVLGKVLGLRDERWCNGVMYWRRRPDSNRRITDLQSAPLTTWVRRRAQKRRILISHHLDAGAAVGAACADHALISDVPRPSRIAVAPLRWSETRCARC